MTTLTPSSGPLDLERDGEDYVGWCVAGRGQRIFGGSTLSQAVRSADLAIGSATRVDALHAIFLSPGDASRPVRYRVSEVKRGRSIDVLAVNALQGDRVILTAHVTFNDGSPSPEFHDEFPDVASPETLSPGDAVESMNALPVRAPFDVRPVPRSGSEPRIDTWVRLRTPSTGGPNVDAALLAYAVDFLITRPAHVPLDPGVVSHFGASLDHAMWFHRPFDVSSWLLVSSVASSFTGSRSLCHSRVFDERGVLVASGAQEALLGPA